MVMTVTVRSAPFLEPREKLRESNERRDGEPSKFDPTWRFYQL
jgi:hypothetical protein